MGQFLETGLVSLAKKKPDKNPKACDRVLQAHQHEEQKDYDEMRTYIINQLGYQVIRFTNEDIFKNKQTVLRKLNIYL